MNPAGGIGCFARVVIFRSNKPLWVDFFQRVEDVFVVDFAVFVRFVSFRDLSYLDMA